ncbi:hypothetical protein Ahy_A07g033306 isoform G [Arachis hypogaea]|uniref:Uncharacterized protein n=1 Tax=Arachis hypogaea TaxID=3818 RepID=A0A445C8U2_ARAHY|nr:hypothetical protein Ahy_A07g033306 isoform G [Arachis hypogaea]
MWLVVIDHKACAIDFGTFGLFKVSYGMLGHQGNMSINIGHLAYSLDFLPTNTAHLLQTACMLFSSARYNYAFLWDLKNGAVVCALLFAFMELKSYACLPLLVTCDGGRDSFIYGS